MAWTLEFQSFHCLHSTSTSVAISIAAEILSSLAIFNSQIVPTSVFLQHVMVALAPTAHREIQSPTIIRRRGILLFEYLDNCDAEHRCQQMQARMLQASTICRLLWYDCLHLSDIFAVKHICPIMLRLCRASRGTAHDPTPTTNQRSFKFEQW